MSECNTSLCPELKSTLIVQTKWSSFTRASLLVCALTLPILDAGPAVGANARSQSKQSERSTAKPQTLKERTSKDVKVDSASAIKKKRLLAQNETELEEDLDAELDEEQSDELTDDLGDLSLDEPASGEDGKTVTTQSATSPQDSSTPAAFVGDEVRITDLKYDASKMGGTVVVQTQGSPTYRVRENPTRNQVVVEIANAKLPDKLKRPFNTKDFKQSIIGFNAYQESGSNTARVVIQFREPRSVEVLGRGETLQIIPAQTAGSSSMAGPSATSSSGFSGAVGTPDRPSAVASSNVRRGDVEPSGESYEVFSGSPSGQLTDGKSTYGGSYGIHSTSKASMALPSSTIDEQRSGGPEFVGKPISIEVRETPVREVIGIIAEQSGANIILSDGIESNMTIKLRQVPWDQALSIIMKSQGLGYVRQGHVLRIAPLARLQQEANEAQAILAAQESMMPLKVRVIPVSFADVTALARQIQNTIQAVSMQAGGAQLGGMGAGLGGFAGQPGQLRGRIEADVRSSSLVVTDTQDNIQKIESLIRALDVPPLQVMIEGKIVEAREELGQAFGIDWGYTGQDLGFAGGTLSQNARFSPGTIPANTTLNLRLGTLDFLGDLSARLTLLERDSKAKIISSPRIVTINNQEAEIAQTVSIPIPQALAGPAGVQTTFAFQEIPTTLKVRPQITPGGDVLMNIFFERQFQVGAGGGGAAGGAGGGAAGGAGGAAGGAQTPIDKRRVQTNVMVKNGQTTVIGGIYQSDQNEDENKTPWLGNVPVLGWLFKNRQSSQIRNELLVFLTPRILNSDHNLPKAEKTE